MGVVVSRVPQGWNTRAPTRSSDNAMPGSILPRAFPLGVSFSAPVLLVTFVWKGNHRRHRWLMSQATVLFIEEKWVSANNSWNRGPIQWFNEASSPLHFAKGWQECLLNRVCQGSTRWIESSEGLLGLRLHLKSRVFCIRMWNLKTFGTTQNSTTFLDYLIRFSKPLYTFWSFEFTEGSAMFLLTKLSIIRRRLNS